MNSEKIKDIATISLVLYLLLGVIGAYPALVIAYYAEQFFGYDEHYTVGIYTWLVSIGVMYVLYWLRQTWLVVILYLVTLVPFILLCIKWYKECSVV